MVFSGLMWPGLLSAEQVTIAMLGDSLTQGYGLPANDGLVPNLEAWLQQRGHDVVLINAGVSGDTTAGGLSRIAWTLTEEVDAIVIGLGGNDVLRGLDPVITKNNLAGLLEVVIGRQIPALLVGMEAPNNYGTEYKMAFDPIYQDLAETYGTLYYQSFFEVFAKNGLTPEQTVEFLQSDRIHPNAQGVDMIVEDMAPFVADLINQIQ